MIQLEQMTKEVCNVARRAGAYIAAERKRFHDESIQRKHAHDYVSYVDKGSEHLIVEALRQLLPEAGYVTEEGTATYDSEQYCWVVDPLDGTTNFLHQFPHSLRPQLKDISSSREPSASYRYFSSSS